MRRWGVYCKDGIAWEDALSKADADLSADEANDSCECRGKHRIRVMTKADGSDLIPAVKNAR